MGAPVFLMSWETPTKCAHDAGHDRGSGRGGGAGAKEGEQEGGGGAAGGPGERRGEGAGDGRRRSRERERRGGAGKRRQRGSQTSPTPLHPAHEDPRAVSRGNGSEGVGRQTTPRGACPPDRPIRAPPLPRPRPRPDPAQPPPPAPARRLPPESWCPGRPGGGPAAQAMAHKTAGHLPGRSSVRRGLGPAVPLRPACPRVAACVACVSVPVPPGAEPREGRAGARARRHGQPRQNAPRGRGAGLRWAAVRRAGSRHDRGGAHAHQAAGPQGG